MVRDLSFDNIRIANCDSLRLILRKSSILRNHKKSHRMVTFFVSSELWKNLEPVIFKCYNSISMTESVNDASNFSASELGLMGDKMLAGEIVGEITKNWGKQHKPSKTPFVLALSGFQGSGKTTALQELDKSNDFISISPDEIRWMMFAHEYFLTEETGDTWRQTVNLARNILLDQALESGYSVAIDQSLNEERIRLIRQMVGKHENYRMTTVLLNPSKETLINRVENRSESIGRYTGTISELKASMLKNGDHDLTLYNLVIDTSFKSLHEVVQQIQSELSK